MSLIVYTNKKREAFLSCFWQPVQKGKLNIYYYSLCLFKNFIKLLSMKKIEKEEKITNRISDVLEKVVYRRKRLGLSQTDIAEKLEITLSGYYKMETGKTKLDVRRLLELSEVLKVDLEYFLKE